MSQHSGFRVVDDAYAAEIMEDIKRNGIGLTSNFRFMDHSDLKSYNHLVRLERDSSTKENSAHALIALIVDRRIPPV